MSQHVLDRNLAKKFSKSQLRKIHECLFTFYQNSANSLSISRIFLQKNLDSNLPNSKFLKKSFYPKLVRTSRIVLLLFILAIMYHVSKHLTVQIVHPHNSSPKSPYDLDFCPQESSPNPHCHHVVSKQTQLASLLP